MSAPVNEQALVARCREGNEAAAQQLYDNYCERLLALARRRLSLAMTRRVDAEDIVQSVFRTFFHRLKEGQFTLEDQDDLCKLLMRITVHKTLRQVAHHRAAKRDLRQEAGQQDDAVQQELRDLLDHEPNAEVAVAFLEQLEGFLTRLKPQERQILEWRLQGETSEEIGRKLGLYDRKVRRVLEHIRRLAAQEEIGL